MNGHIDSQLIKSVCNQIDGAFTITFSAKGVCLDTNRLKPGEIFVPIKGQHYDGHHFIETAIENGAIATFWQKEETLPKTVPKDFPVFYVDDSLDAVIQMADQYLFEIDPVTIAITGDYSRFVTKTLLEKVLASSYNIHESKRHSGDRTEIIETILSMPPETDALICDLSSNSKDSLISSSKLLQPSFAIISESDDFSKYGAISSAIEQGMKRSGTIFINGDLSIYDGDWKADVMKYGINEENLFQVHKIEKSDEIVTFQIPGVLFMDFELPVLFSNHLKSVAAVIGMAIHLGIDAEKIYSALKKTSLEELSLDQIGMANESVVLFDHDYVEESDVEYSLGMLKHLHDFKRRVLIVDEGFQANPLDKTLHETFAIHINAPITDVITIGEKAFWVTEALNRSADDKLNSKHFKNHAQAMEIFKELLQSSSLILYRGANRKLLEQMIHELNRR
ncbi:Mur ligase domain-containing protein [Salipaludibacillus sp. HK11]|uniref:Mur ligase domain-containing protein n=1 Tax=Salipaludibacillus sp. HK11 TaxID=3394320 RepID=UPI0039FCD720